MNYLFGAIGLANQLGVADIKAVNLTFY